MANPLDRDDLNIDLAKVCSVAREQHNEHTGEYLFGMPLCADYLETGLDAFDLSCADLQDGA